MTHHSFEMNCNKSFAGIYRLGDTLKIEIKRDGTGLKRRMSVLYDVG